MSSSNVIPPDERREFFRVGALMGVRCERVGPAEFQSRMLQFEDYSASHARAHLGLGQIPLDHSMLQRALEDMPPALAYFLENLSRRVDLLTNLVLNSAASQETFELQPVEVSATGIRFHTVQPLKVEDHVELRLMLYPERVQLLCYGCVVRVETTGSADLVKAVKVAIRLEAIKDADREVLIRHILHCEAEAKKQAVTPD